MQVGNAMKTLNIRIGFVPIARPAFVFGFLQKYITTGIPTTGMK